MGQLVDDKVKRGIKNVWKLLLKWLQEKEGLWAVNLGMSFMEVIFWITGREEISKWCSVESYGDRSLTAKSGTLGNAYILDKDKNGKLD